MRRVRVAHEGGELWLDLTRIDHQQVFLDGEVRAEPAERMLLRHWLGAGSRAVDVGAHLGSYTVPLARLCGSSGFVVAYEPNPSALWRTIAPYPQVVLRPFAVSDGEGTVIFRSERSTALSHSVSPAEKQTGDEDIGCVSLDADLARLGVEWVDFLKIDVEGHETEVLLGARRLLCGPRAPIVQMEWVPAFRARAVESALAALREMVGREWLVVGLGWSSQCLFELSTVGEPDVNATLFAFPPGRVRAYDALLREHPVGQRLISSQL